MCLKKIQFSVINFVGYISVELIFPTSKTGVAFIQFSASEYNFVIYSIDYFVGMITVLESRFTWLQRTGCISRLSQDTHQLTQAQALRQAMQRTGCISRLSQDTHQLTQAQAPRQAMQRTGCISRLSQDTHQLTQRPARFLPLE